MSLCDISKRKPQVPSDLRDNYKEIQFGDMCLLRLLIGFVLTALKALKYR